ncbi:MAG TPA: hypothetical protein VG944_04920, partial [Fimbriimonas sp.]|nr:hypothetical protein [Fimbriimonas sp.]
MDTKLDAVSKRQEAVFDSMSKILEGAIAIFGSVAAVVAIVGFVQLRNDSRVMKMLQADLEDRKSVSERFQANMDSSTKLVDTVRQVVSFEEQMREKVSHMQGVIEDVGKGKAHRDRQTRELNDLAIEVSVKEKVARKSIQDPVFQRRAEQFAEAYRSVESFTDVAGKLNANCFYLLGLDHRIRGNYAQAKTSLKLAIEVAEDHLSRADAEVLYSALPLGKSMSAS